MNKIFWGSYFFLTYDENGISQYDTGEDGIGIMLDAGCSGDKLKITKGDGQTIETSALGSGWFKIRFEMDLSANYGQGSGNVLFKSLTDGDTTWNEISEFQNFNLALDPNATTAANPYNWDGIRVHFVGKTGGLDNMILEYQ